MRNYADELGCVVWNSDAKRYLMMMMMMMMMMTMMTRTLVVTKDGHDDVKRYWRQQSRR